MAQAPAREGLGRVRRLLGQIGIVRLLLTLLLLAAAVIAARSSWDLPLLGDAERGLYDLRFTNNAPQLQQPDQRVTLVTYQDSTLRDLQKRSPLDRRTLAQALRAIDAIGPRAIGIDILFDQPQAEDDELIAALNAMRTPTYIAFVTFESNYDQMVPQQETDLRAFFARITNDKVHPASIRFDGDGADNVMRRWPERAKGLPTFLANAMVPERADMADYSGAIRYRLPPSENPHDLIGAFPELEISAFAPAGDPSLPPEARDAILNAPELHDLIAGRYVLIGGDINGVDDFDTPMSRLSTRQMKGIAIHAQMLRQLIDDEAPAQWPSAALWLAAILVVLAGAVTGFLELRSIALVLCLVVQLGALGALPFLLQSQGVDTINLPAAGWPAGWLLAYLGLGIAARAVGSEQRRFAHSALGRYLPADVAREILRDPERLKLTGEKKQIYALFTDLEGFTKLSHAIAPEQLSALLNRYLDMLSDTVLAHGGTIDKFVGDAVVAFWGAPLARPDDGERAVRAAIAMFECGERFRAGAEPGIPPIGATRVGLHRGEAVIGNFGGEQRIQYTALGDGMNTASRLESANKALQTIVLISREALEGLSLEPFRPMGRILLSGRSTPVEVWEPAPAMDAAEREQLRELWARYDGGDASALAELEQEAAARPEDGALRNFVHRIREAGPGGLFVLASK
jgi:adenylate cyclase